MMATVPYSSVEVKGLCDEVALYGVKVSRTNAWELLRYMSANGGNRHIAVDAILMKKRPTWLEEMIGPWESQKDATNT